MKKQKVRLTLEQNISQRLLDKYGFRVRDIQLQSLKDGWLCVSLNWTSDKDTTLFKYCYSAGTMFTDDATSQEVNFTYLSKRFKASLDIGIQTVDPEEDIQYSVKYFQNTKYGIAVYFAPKNAHQVKETIEQYDFDDKGILIDNREKVC